MFISHHFFRDKGISWAQSFSKLIAFFEKVSDMWALFNMPLSTAGLTTESCCLGSIWSHLKGFSTYLTDNSYRHNLPPVAYYNVILRICQGVGTMGVAAIKNRCHFIGIEKEAHYCETAEERIAKAKEETAQLEMVL